MPQYSCHSVSSKGAHACTTQITSAGERAADALGNLHLEPGIVVPAFESANRRQPSRSMARNQLLGPVWARSSFGGSGDKTPFHTNQDFDAAARSALKAIAPGSPAKIHRVSKQVDSSYQVMTNTVS